jgi:hypothetical protein
MNAVRDILAVFGIDSVEDMEIHQTITVENQGFEDLVIEKVGDHHLSCMHYYLQRMDMMRDPEIVFDTSGDDWTAVMFKQDPTVFRQDETGLPGATAFAEGWSETLEKQGFVEAAKEHGAADPPQHSSD